MKRRLSIAALALVLLSVAPACQMGKVGSRCRPNGEWGRNNTHILRCEKGRWKRSITIQQYANLLLAPKAPVGPPAPAESVSQRNAREMGASYLRSSAFSRQGLIDQLEYEGFSNADAVYGTDSQGADWNTQAARMAAQYLRSSAFSRQGLIDQLIYEKFTPQQAEYGVSTTGL